jgi:hypothetical protein
LKCAGDVLGFVTYILYSIFVKCSLVSMLD